MRGRDGFFQGKERGDRDAVAGGAFGERETGTGDVAGDGAAGVGLDGAERGEVLFRGGGGLSLFIEAMFGRAGDTIL